MPGREGADPPQKATSHNSDSAATRPHHPCPRSSLPSQGGTEESEEDRQLGLQHLAREPSTEQRSQAHLIKSIEVKDAHRPTSSFKASPWRSPFSDDSTPSLIGLHQRLLSRGGQPGASALSGVAASVAVSNSRLDWGRGAGQGGELAQRRNFSIGPLQTRYTSGASLSQTDRGPRSSHRSATGYSGGKDTVALQHPGAAYSRSVVGEKGGFASRREASGSAGACLSASGDSRKWRGGGRQMKEDANFVDEKAGPEPLANWGCVRRAEREAGLAEAGCG